MSLFPNTDIKKWISLFLITLPYIFIEAVQYLLAYLYSLSIDLNDDEDEDFLSIKKALNLTDTEYSIIIGYGYTILYSICLLFYGDFGDRLNRKYLLVGGGALVFTGSFLLGTADDFTQLLISKIVHSIGKGLYVPATFSLLKDFFPDSELGLASSILTSAIAIGDGFSSFSIAIALHIGWRATCILYSIIGFGTILLLLLFLKRPDRKHEMPSDKMPLLDIFKFIKDSTLLKILYIATMIRFIGTYVILYYLPDYYDYVFGYDEETYSYVNGVIQMFSGPTAALLIGALIDQLEAVNYTYGRVLLPSFAIFVSIPFVVLVLYISNFWGSIIAFFFEDFFAELWLGPVISLVIITAPRQYSSQFNALLIACYELTGSFGAVILGYVIDDVTNNETESLTSIGWCMAIMIIPSYFISAVLFYESASHLPVKDPDDIPEIGFKALYKKVIGHLMHHGYEEIKTSDPFFSDDEDDNNDEEVL